MHINFIIIPEIRVDYYCTFIVLVVNIIFLFKNIIQFNFNAQSRCVAAGFADQDRGQFRGVFDDDMIW